jgi:uncharacterized protein involved in outer membrane biogenesis
VHRTRRLLMLTAAIAVLAALAILGLRQALAGDRVRAIVEARLSAMLGQPVSVGHLGFALFPRVSLVGGNVRLGQARVQAPGLDIERVRVLPRLRSVWTGNVVIEQIELDGFLVSVLRDRQGRWHVPYAVPAPSAGGERTAEIQGLRVSRGRIRVFDEDKGGIVSERSSIDDLEAEFSVDTGGLRLAPITGRIGRAKISGEARTDAAAVHLTFAADAIADEDLPVLLRLLGSDRPAFLRLAEAASATVAVQIDRASARLTGKGMLRAPQVLLEPLRLQRFEAPFVINGTILEFDPTVFAMYRGTHSGSITVALADAPPFWTTNSRVNDLAVGEFLKALTGRDQHVDGVGSINGSLRGRVGEPLDRSVSGRTHVVVTNGVVRNFPLLATINRALRVAEQESGDTRFERLEAHLTVADGQATTDDLVLGAGDLRVEARGRIGADRSLALRGTAIVSAARVAREVASVPEVARLRNSSGQIEVPLTISGTLDAPSIAVDLNTAIRRGVMDELRRRIRRLIR